MDDENLQNKWFDQPLRVKLAALKSKFSTHDFDYQAGINKTFLYSVFRN